MTLLTDQELRSLRFSSGNGLSRRNVDRLFAHIESMKGIQAMPYATEAELAAAREAHGRRIAQWAAIIASFLPENYDTPGFCRCGGKKGR